MGFFKNVVSSIFDSAKNKMSETGSDILKYTERHQNKSTEQLERLMNDKKIGFAERIAAKKLLEEKNR